MALPKTTSTRAIQHAASAQRASAATTITNAVPHLQMPPLLTMTTGFMKKYTRTSYYSCFSIGSCVIGNNYLVKKYGQIVYHPFLDYETDLENFISNFDNQTEAEEEVSSASSLLLVENFRKSLLSNVYSDKTKNINVVLCMKKNHAIFHSGTHKRTSGVPEGLNFSRVIWMVPVVTVTGHEDMQAYISSLSGPELYDFALKQIKENIDDDQRLKNKTILYAETTEKTYPSRQQLWFTQMISKSYLISNIIGDIEQAESLEKSRQSVLASLSNSRRAVHQEPLGLHVYNNLFDSMFVTKDYMSVYSNIRKKLSEYHAQSKKEVLRLKKESGKTLREINREKKAEIIKNKNNSVNVLELSREMAMVAELSLSLNNLMEECQEMKTYLENPDNRLNTRNYKNRIERIKLATRTIKRIKKQQEEE